MQVLTTISDRNFSSQSLEYVETEKSRIVLLELEKDWWVVAVSMNWALYSTTLPTHSR